MKAKLFISIFIALSSFPRLAAGKIAFKAAESYPLGTAPLAIASGDFNDDGKPDLAVANSGNGSADSGGISILLGNGDGTFQPATNVNAGKNPGSVVAADLNGDGRVDLVVTNGDSSGQVGVLLGNGDGTFQPVVDYGAGNGLKAIALGDFNGDLRPDVVVANAFDSTVSILLGDGDGSFQTHVDYKTGGVPGSIVVADFDGDGKVDLAVACSFGGSNVAVLMGNGDGTFQASVPYDTGSAFGPVDVTVGDFNGDGKTDLIVDFLVSVGIDPPRVNRRLDLLAGNGDGTFQLFKGVVASVGSGVLSAADFDGDGKLDVALNGLVFFPGNGDGTFQAPVVFPVTPTGTLLTADLNRDKAPDLLIVDQTNNVVAVVLNVGTDFSVSPSPVSPGSISPGQSATSTLSLNLLNAFNNPVSLSCSVQPAQAGAPSCSVNPSSVTFDGSGKGTSQLTITAGMSAALLTQPSTHPGSQPWHWLWLPIAGFALVGTGLARTNVSRRISFGPLLVCLLFAALFLQAACGGNGGPKSQPYSITVTALSGSNQRTSTVTITVQ